MIFLRARMTGRRSPLCERGFWPLSAWMRRQRDCILVVHCRMDPPAPTGLLHWDCTGRIIGAFYYVYNELGPGLVERAYCRALHAELDQRGCDAIPERALEIRYGTEKRIRFRADFVVDGRVVVEIKARSCLPQGHWAQLINYLRVSQLQVGLLLNFGPRPEFKRIVLSKGYKRSGATS